MLIRGELSGPNGMGLPASSTRLVPLLLRKVTDVLMSTGVNSDCTNATFIIPISKHMRSFL